MHLRHASVIVLLAMAAAACGSSSAKGGSPNSSSASGASSSAAASNPYGGNPSPVSNTTVATMSAAAVKVSGDKLVDATGFTVYAFSPDTATTSACNTGCDALWPPITATGAPPSIAGLTVTTLTRSDGSKQVVVNGHPLYKYAGDAKPGDEKGQGLGGKWYYVNSKGEPDKG